MSTAAEHSNDDSPKLSARRRNASRVDFEETCEEISIDTVNCACRRICIATRGEGVPDRSR